MTAFAFEVERESGQARAGRFSTPHGIAETPTFMPVGTQATVKALDPEDLRGAGARIILANAYHLHLRPGDTLIRDLGGLHRFMHWDGPILTDSGGFQVFSLSGLRTLDGRRRRCSGATSMDRSSAFTPETVMEIERNLGADIVMQFDHVIAGQSDHASARDASERSVRWLRRLSARAMGALIPARRRSAASSRAAPTPTCAATPRVAIMRHLGDWAGFGIRRPVGRGGQARHVSNPRDGHDAGSCPRDRPRYLMGVGFPEDLIEGVARGVDLFDCVAPTRMGRRNGAAFTRDGRTEHQTGRVSGGPAAARRGVRTASALRRDSPGRTSGTSFMADEILGLRLLSLHNVHFPRSSPCARRARRSLAKTFDAWSRDWLARYHSRPATTA